MIGCTFHAHPFDLLLSLGLLLLLLLLLLPALDLSCQPQQRCEKYINVRIRAYQVSRLIISGQAALEEMARKLQLPVSARK